MLVGRPWAETEDLCALVPVSVVAATELRFTRRRISMPARPHCAWGHENMTTASGIGGCLRGIAFQFVESGSCVQDSPRRNPVSPSLVLVGRAPLTSSRATYFPPERRQP